MKVFIVLFAILGLALCDWTPANSEDMEKARDKCVKELSISDASLKKIKEWDIEDDENAMCFIRCLVQTTGLWDDIEGLNLDRVYKTNEADEFPTDKEELKKCANKVMDVSACHWAALNMKCIKQKNEAAVKKTHEK